MHCLRLVPARHSLSPRCRMSARAASRAMHRLNGIYAQRFNNAVTEGVAICSKKRFAAWVIESDEHLHAAIHYVVQNPVAAGVCHDSRDWIWSWPRLDSVAVWDMRGTVPGTRRNEAATRLQGREQDDVHLAGAVDADHERLLDVRAPARAGHDRERARQALADGREQLLEPREGAVLGKQRDVNVRQERARPRLVGRRREHDAARLREAVDGGRDAGALDLRRDASMDDGSPASSAFAANSSTRLIADPGNDGRASAARGPCATSAPARRLRPAAVPAARARVETR